MFLFIVVIIGRLNVGKFIIVNCLVESKDVIVYDELGIICDCIY